MVVRLKLSFETKDWGRWREEANGMMSIRRARKRIRAAGVR